MQITDYPKELFNLTSDASDCESFFNWEAIQNYKEDDIIIWHLKREHKGFAFYEKIGGHKEYFVIYGFKFFADSGEYLIKPVFYDASETDCWEKLRLDLSRLMILSEISS